MRPDSERCMHLEKLSVLEDRIDRLIEHFNRLKEDKNVLERSLDEKVGRLADLEREVEQLRQERDVIRDRLGRLVDIIDRLESLETAEPSTRT
jgi:chromosome segregation ATPase